MRGYAEPSRILLRFIRARYSLVTCANTASHRGHSLPSHRCSGRRLRAVRLGEGGARVDHGEIADDADQHVLGLEIFIATGFAVCFRNAARSTSEPSGLLQ